MKVAVFQKHLRAVGDLISAKSSAKEFVDAADALTPFANHTMEDFAKFLKLAEAKYSTTGELPDGKPVPPPKQPRVKKDDKSQAPALTTTDLAATIAALKVRLRTDQTLAKDGVAAELNKYKSLSKPDLVAAVLAVGIKKKPGTKDDALTALVNHTLAAQAGVERSDA